MGAEMLCMLCTALLPVHLCTCIHSFVYLSIHAFCVLVFVLCVRVCELAIINE